jgi:hypothetical protein
MNFKSQPLAKRTQANFLMILLLGVVILSVFFAKSCLPGYVLFSNDGPLGAQNQNALALPEAFHGVWYDANFIGNSGGSTSPTLTSLLAWALGPLGFSKFFIPLTLLFLCLCA